MMNRVRKAPPSSVRYIYRAIANAKFEQLTMEQLIKILKHDALVSDETATEIVTNCINDKILIPVVIDNGRGSPRLKVAEGRPLSLPKPWEIPSSQHDLYCFECHLPGNLDICPRCPRSFHRDCCRKEPERPNYEVPSAKVQKNPLPEFSSDGENLDYEPETKSSTPHLAANIRDTSANANSVQSALIEEQKGHFDFNIDTKSKVDVMCLGEVRPPTRSRRSNVTSSYTKNEVITFDDDEHEGALCTCCRLSKCAELRNPPNLNSDELCYLLNFTYARNQSWIAPETITYLDSLKPNENTDLGLQVLSKVLLQIPTAPKDISHRIENNEYTFLMEFLIDILDIQHNIGVLYGESTEFDSTKWLVRDVNHDLAEIGRCPDCYRYSNQKKTRGWFCKPCVQRHELVFAKHPGFPFWPAKVIRVLPNNKYDVRFFGGKHSRALVDVKNIRPIDTDQKQLKLTKTNAVRAAMEELKHHQMLLHYPPSQFSFRADRQQVEAILERVLVVNTNKRPRRSDVSNIRVLVEEDNGEHSMNVTQGSSKKRRRNENSPNRVNTCHTRSKEDLYPTLNVEKLQRDLDGALQIIKDDKKKKTELLNQIKCLKDKINKMERNMEIIKRKQWCFCCLKEAVLLCCFKASYCSKECQKSHWEEGHSKSCKNRDSH